MTEDILYFITSNSSIAKEIFKLNNIGKKWLAKICTVGVLNPVVENISFELVNIFRNCI